jgi:hypothetical protein
MLESVASATTELEAEMIRGRLSEAGIKSMLKPSGSSAYRSGWRAGGACEVCVEQQDLDRAREVLSSEIISEDELIREEELAAREAAANDPSKSARADPSGS